jgi:hypothetical protein
MTVILLLQKHTAVTDLYAVLAYSISPTTIVRSYWRHQMAHRYNELRLMAPVLGKRTCTVRMSFFLLHCSVLLGSVSPCCYREMLLCTWYRVTSLPNAGPTNDAEESDRYRGVRIALVVANAADISASRYKYCLILAHSLLLIFQVINKAWMIWQLGLYENKAF